MRNIFEVLGWFAVGTAAAPKSPVPPANPVARCAAAAPPPKLKPELAVDVVFVPSASKMVPVVVNIVKLRSRTSIAR